MRRLLSLIGWLLGSAFIVGLLGVGAFVFVWPRVAEYREQMAERARGKMVTVEAASYGTLVRTISAPGTVTPRTEVNITSRVSAKIVRLPALAGDEVREGDILVELDPKELEARLDAARARLLADQAALKSAQAALASDEAALLGIKASLQKATADYERNQDLFDSGDVSASDLESFRAELDRQRSSHEARLAALKGAEANVEAALARVKVAEADVSEAEENLSYTVIRSPMDGVVTIVNSREGENVLGTRENAGNVILVVADLSEMLVEAELSEMDAPKVREGQGVTVNINGYPDRVFTGELRRVGLQSKFDDRNNRYFEAEVVLDLEDGDRLFAGLTADVDIEIEKIEDSIVVPSQAVLDKRVDDLPPELRQDSPHVDPDEPYAQVVFVLDGETAIMTPVAVSGSNLTRTAIAGGVDEGAEVIVGPYRSLQSLADGDEVRRMERPEGGRRGGPPGYADAAVGGGGAS